jgi:cyclopropane-fatty-acyl-phospholipid synthase
LREHYALTLCHWVQRLETHHDQALRHVDEVMYHVWRLFMLGSADGFEAGRHNVYQSLLVRPAPDGQSGLPLTRAILYAPVNRSCRSYGDANGKRANEESRRKGLM